MDTKCSGDRCAALQRQTDQAAVACTKPASVKEDNGADGWLANIPGMTSTMYN